jgi:transcription elongation factor Elf1
MQRHVNVTIPLACPHCLTELLATLDDVQQEQTIRCSACGTDVELRAKDHLPLPAVEPAADQIPFGIQF